MRLEMPGMCLQVISVVSVAEKEKDTVVVLSPVQGFFLILSTIAL